MLKRLGLSVVALMLILAACGDGGGLSGEAQAKADEIKDELLEDTSAENPFADEAAAECFADGLVSEFGLDRINELDSGEGVEAGFENMTAAEQETVADLALDCIDFQDMMREMMVNSGLPADQADCVADALDDDLMKALFLAEISGEEPANSEELMGVVMEGLIG